MKKALITGVTGQDGSYLAEFLLEQGYDVHGIIRRSSVDYRERIAHLEGKEHFHLHYGDMGDSMGLIAVISKVRPDEIYNLAAQSHVQVSFDAPEFTADVDATGVLLQMVDLYLIFRMHHLSALTACMNTQTKSGNILNNLYFKFINTIRNIPDCNSHSHRKIIKLLCSLFCFICTCNNLIKINRHIL